MIPFVSMTHGRCTLPVLILLSLQACSTMNTSPSSESPAFMEYRREAIPKGQMYALFFDTMDEEAAYDREMVMAIYDARPVSFPTFHVDIAALPEELSSRFAVKPAERMPGQWEISPLGTLVLVNSAGEPLRSLEAPFFEEEVEAFYFPDEVEQRLYQYE